MEREIEHEVYPENQECNRRWTHKNAQTDRGTQIAGCSQGTRTIKSVIQIHLGLVEICLRKSKKGGEEPWSLDTYSREG